MAGSKAALCGLVLGLLVFEAKGFVKTSGICVHSSAPVATGQFPKAAGQGRECAKATHAENFDASDASRISLPRWAEVTLMIPGALVYLGIGFYACMALAVSVIRDDRVFGSQRHR